MVADDIADTLGEGRQRLARWPASLKMLLRDDGTPMQEGDKLVQKDLAATLTAIAEQGPRGFYQGPVAEKLVKGISDAGGIMTTDDLKSYQPTIRTPAHGTYRGYDIVSMPLPSSGGVVLLETLNILEGFPLPDIKQGSAASLHLMIEAMKRAYADRAHYLGDPAYVDRAGGDPDDQGIRHEAARRHRSRPCHAVEGHALDDAARRQQHQRIFRWSTATATRSAIPTR